MVGLRPDKKGGALGLKSLADRQPGGSAAETEVKANEPGTDPVAVGTEPADVEPADAVPELDAELDAQPTASAATASAAGIW